MLGEHKLTKEHEKSVFYISEQSSSAFSKKGEMHNNEGSVNTQNNLDTHMIEVCPDSTVSSDEKKNQGLDLFNLLSAQSKK